jgi:hypothetical protein
MNTQNFKKFLSLHPHSHDQRPHILTIPKRSPSSSKTPSPSRIKSSNRNNETDRRTPYYSRIKDTFQNQSTQLLDKLQNLNSNIENLDDVYKKYYAHQTLRPRKDINKSLGKEYVFYKDDQPEKESSRYKSSLYLEGKHKLPNINSVRSARKIQLEETLTTRVETLTTEEFEKTTDHPTLITDIARNENYIPNGLKAVRQAKFVELDGTKMPVELYLTTIRRKGIIRELTAKKGVHNREILVQRLHTESEHDSNYLSMIERTKTEESTKQKKNIMNKNPYSNTYYQILAMPKAQRNRVLNKLQNNSSLSSFKMA